MASLTPLSKGLIAVAIVGAMASAVWHLGLKEWLAARNAPSATESTQVQPEPQVPVPAPAVAPTPAAVAETKSPAPAAPSNATAVNHAEQGRKLLAGGDYAQARTHLEQAVKEGDGSAACLLGEMTMKGQGGITVSQEKAASLFQLAQSRGSICFASN